MKRRRTLIAYILTFVIVLGSFSTVYSDETKDMGFTDLSSSYWAKQSIDHLISLDIVNNSLLGSTEFKPNERMTRAETVELVLKANLPKDLLKLALEEVYGQNSFTDTNNHKLKDYIELAKNLGIVNGYPDGSFRSDGMITREEFATILINSQDIFEDIAKSKSISIFFSDISHSHWAYKNIQLSAMAGLILGYPDGTFGLGKDITKAEAYSMINNYYNLCFLRYEGIVGFVANQSKIAENVDVKIINIKEGNIAQEVKTNKYGQFRFHITEKNNYRIEASNDDLLAIVPKVSIPLEVGLLEARLDLEQTVQIAGTVYNTSSSLLSKGDLLFESGDLEFKTVTDSKGKFELKLLPNKIYKVYKTINRRTTKIGEVKLGTSEITNLLFRPTEAPIDYWDNGGDSGSNPPTPPTPPIPPDPPTPPVIPDGYSVTDIRAREGSRNISLEISASDICYLDVKVLSDVSGISTDWTSGSELGRGRIQIENQIESEFVDVPISFSLPQYFVVVASLVDSRGNKLCEPFVFIEYTNAYEEFKAKTVDDFDGKRVINLDGAKDNNFLVLNDGVIKVNEGEGGKNRLNVSEIDNGVYVFEDADDIISSLNIGGKIAVISEDGDNIYLIKVRVIRKNGTTVTITEDSDHTMSDFLNFIKMEMSEDVDSVLLDMSGASEGVVLLGEPTFNRSFMSSIQLININDVRSTGIKFGISLETANAKLSGEISTKIKVQIRVIYDFHLFGKDYLDTKFSLGLETDSEARLELKVEDDEAKDIVHDYIYLGEVIFPFGITGLAAVAKLTVPLDWEVSGSANIASKIVTESGFVYRSNSGYQPIDQKSYDSNINVAGTARVAFGPKAAFSVEFLRDIVKAQISAFGGVELKGTAERIIVATGDSRHACTLCVDGSLDKFAKMGFELTYKITKHLTGTPVDITLGEYRRYMFDFYASLINDVDSVHKGLIEFGKGECPNIAYKTIFDPQNEAGSTLTSATVTVRNKVTNTEVFSGTGKFTKYMYPGEYVASASGGGSTFVDKEFTVSSRAQTIIISPQSSSVGLLRGSVKDAEDNRSIPNARVNVYEGATKRYEKSTDNGGNYEISLPVGNYRVEIEAQNYIPFICYVTIERDSTHYMETFLMITDEIGIGNTTVIIKNAKTGSPIEGVNLVARKGWNNSSEGEVVGTFTTDSSGRYDIATLSYGNYTLTASLENYVTDTINIIVKKTHTEKNHALSPLSNDDVYSVVLTWGLEPRDLDSHLVSEGVRVYYGDKQSTYAWLDIDDTTSYGPETITVNNLGGLGGFKYCVHNYTDRYATSGAYGLPNSNAQVKVYKGTELLKSYNVPTSGDGTVWNVFSITADGYITDLNTFDYQSDPRYVGYSSGENIQMLFFDSHELKDYEILDLIVPEIEELP